MKANVIRPAVLSFWYCLLLGLLTLGILLGEMWSEISQHLLRLALGFSVGFGLGVAVFLIEKWIYIRRRSRGSGTSLYRTTVLPVSTCLLLLAVPAVASTSELAYVLAFASSVYLLTLAVILFLVRKSQEINIF
ncbi:MAG: hypothetical protein WCC12_11800 [Anaerolineales bacterium]